MERGAALVFNAWPVAEEVCWCFWLVLLSLFHLFFMLLMKFKIEVLFLGKYSRYWSPVKTFVLRQFVWYSTSTSATRKSLKKVQILINSSAASDIPTTLFIPNNQTQDKIQFHSPSSHLFSYSLPLTRPSWISTSFCFPFKASECFSPDLNPPSPSLLVHFPIF